MEQVVLSDSTPPDAHKSAPGLGLNFRQFVDALARCGLIGFSGNRTTTSGGVSTGLLLGGGGLEIDRGGITSSGTVVKQLKSEPVSAAERAHTIFIRQMKLLDGQHVDAKLQQLMHLHPTTMANDDGGQNIGTTTVENEKGRRGNAAGKYQKKKKTGSLQKMRGTATDHTPGSLRGGGSRRAVAAAADPPKPNSSLAPIQASTTTTRGGKKP